MRPVVSFGKYKVGGGTSFLALPSDLNKLYIFHSFLDVTETFSFVQRI